MSEGTKNLRRSARIKNNVKSKEVEPRKKSPSKQLRSSKEIKKAQSPINVETNTLDEKDDTQHIEENIQKPIELFSDEDVCGKTLYGFQTPKKDGMAQKANLCRSVNASKKHRKLPVLKIVLEKLDINKETVKNLNKKKKSPNIKGHQKSFKSGLTSSESESVSEDSEFKPSDEETDETDSSVHNSSDENNSFNKTGKQYISKQKVVPQQQLMKTPKRLDNKRKVSYKDYDMKTDEYFEMQLEKTVTSSRTLSSLKNFSLRKEKLEELLINQNHIMEKHKESICSLTENCTALFPMWHFIMEQGYSLLLHGLGSKRSLINNFHKYVTINHPTLIINGFFPSITIKDILDSIITDLLGLNCPANATHCIDIISQSLRKNPKHRLYLLIHNIDGVMLRSNKTQDILSCLANIPNLYLLASVDHINAPLIWDHVKHSKFNFYWWDATTFLPYQAEISYESSLLIQQSGALELSSLHNVFLSLTSNARSVYIILAEYQLENSKNNNYTGMAFKDLYRSAREKFLVSSDLALRAQLTEFIDHKLVRTKRNIDGGEHLIIPLSDGLLKQFLEQHKS